MTSDERIKQMVAGTYTKKVKRGAPMPRPTDPKPVKEPRPQEMGQAFVLKYECDCGARVPESAKQCPGCKRVNPEYLRTKFGMKMKE